MKEKLSIVIVAVVIMIACFMGYATWLLSGSGSTYYYTQIDNDRIRQVNSRGGVIDLRGGMDYSYTLRAYDDKGQDKEITFGTSRELREGAFLCLTMTPVRGVIEWSEVKYDELPVAVQRIYGKEMKKPEENEFSLGELCMNIGWTKRGLLQGF